MEYPLGIVEYCYYRVYQWNTGPVFYQSSCAKPMMVRYHGTWPCGPGTMPHNEQPRLPALAVDPERVSIGGISTGADLAANYLLAHSASTCGAAIWAGNAPRCAVTRFAQDVLQKCRDKAACIWPACDASVRPCPAGYRLDPSKCQGPCPGPFAPHAGDPSRFVGRSIQGQNVSELQAVARWRAAAGKIDDPDRFLERRRLFAYRGAKDTCYLRGAVDHTASFFGPQTDKRW